MTVKSNSRNKLTEVVAVVDPVLGTLVRPEFVDLRPRVQVFSEDDQEVTVTSAMSWANLADRKLGDGTLWWIIADLNNIIDPFEELEVGKSLRVPSIGTVLFRVLSPENK